MHTYIITGTSRGIGESMAHALLDSGNQLICISRSDNPELKFAAEEAQVRLKYILADLSQTYDSQHLMQVILSGLDQESLESLSLIHNAGYLEPIGFVGTELDTEDTVQNVHVNYLSPMLMTQEFVNRTQEWEVQKRVLVISSGAARKPRAGWSAYCSAKAGVEMYARCLAEEQQEQAYPVEVVSMAPGVVDTRMQDLIREQSVEVFPSVGRFHALKANQQLWSPDFVAKHTLALLHREDFGQQVVLDLRDLV